MRVGQGFDVHGFAPGRKLILGGVEVDYHLGLAGHSDADVLSHALGDALLGAAALGDLGRLFPDSDPEWAGVSSLRLLSMIIDLVRAKGYELVNADLTLIADKPKIAPYVSKMREKLAQALGAEASAISIKATTTEGLGYTGRGEGMAAQAVVLLKGVER